jgi:Domain of unknown function (DUF4397)
VTSSSTCVGLGVGVLSLVATLGLPATAAPPSGELQVVQATPGVSVSIAIDGKRVRSGVGVGSVVGPYKLSPGTHEVRFLGGSGTPVTRTSVKVRSGASSDVVLHRPASLRGDAVVNVYSTPRAAIGPGKARVLIAHTATVAPADVRVDGKRIFTNIANGEFATADVPAGQHRVALLATGEDTEPILGPIDVTLQPRTVTMVYAVGTPKNGSMRVIAHAAQLTADGTVKPATIKTGSAGLARGAVGEFAADRTAVGSAGPLSAALLLPLVWASHTVR